MPKAVDSGFEPVAEVQRPNVATEGVTAAPELIPVPASVFDDDFFQSTTRGGATESGDAVERLREANHFSAINRVQQQESVRVAIAEPEEGVVRGATFDAAVAPAESDELDIPAFLRRGN